MGSGSPQKRFQQIYHTHLHKMAVLKSVVLLVLLCCTSARASECNDSQGRPGRIVELYPREEGRMFLTRRYECLLDELEPRAVGSKWECDAGYTLVGAHFTWPDGVLAARPDKCTPVGGRHTPFHMPLPDDNGLDFLSKPSPLQVTLVQDGMPMSMPPGTNSLSAWTGPTTVLLTGAPISMWPLHSSIPGIDSLSHSTGPTAPELVPGSASILSMFQGSGSFSHSTGGAALFAIGSLASVAPGIDSYSHWTGPTPECTLQGTGMVSIAID